MSAPAMGEPQESWLDQAAEASLRIVLRKHGGHREGAVRPGQRASCREADPTDPVGEALAGRRHHRREEVWDTPLFDAVVAERGVPGTTDVDDEEFCGTCPDDRPDTTDERSQQ